ncbi:MAG: hypothetical protein Q7J78_01045, partial [Clostridiales bacterium]|nr:hypothetical protein [Clostridiales bacterium]
MNAIRNEMTSLLKLKVSEKRTSQLPISRLVLGNFIENGFGRQINGMWAEMIYNRSFRDIPPYSKETWTWLGFEPQYYNSNAPFWHSGYEECDWELIAPDNSFKRRTLGMDSFKGCDSLEIKYDGKAGA